MNKICTDIYQSEKLIELGIDVKTADMGWNIFSDDSTRLLPIDDWDLVKDGWGRVEFIPAWSLSALLGLMSTFTLNGFSNGQFNCRDERANSYALVDTCPLDAAFEMVVWLKENGKI